MPEVNDYRLRKVFGLAGKTAVITGASSGIGTAVASLFLAAGARLALTATTPKKLEATVARLHTEGKQTEDVFGVPTDISQESQVIAFFDQVATRYGRVDILVNCAGIFPVVPFFQSSVELWDRVHEINTRGTYLCIREALRKMLIDDQGGAIVAVSSLAAKRSMIFGHAHYGSSKAGVNMLVRTVALEYADKNIRANAVMPGTIRTAGLTAAIEEHKISSNIGPTKDLSRFPMGRIGHADEVASACLFLASPAASFITGECLVVDGGLSLS
ncbi:short-chain dehydrogenase [Steroidobacter denitrificans]|uniref:Short-chain dehydrogenase n=1 Tax=Steroidobacter denitrificans TaxID=465721 RepID=A0A127F9C6_STEDE|nr:SDR family NAD(P)-dependent oxidoreductase [Steroidobacter denitrificans]AMN46241.1 short-chain dehydrogenase [Steroidobacter denitrificans]